MPPMESIAQTWGRLLEAVSFAGRAHHGQRRKDGRTPYAVHPFRVALIVRHIFGIDDSAALTAALLHDIIEDTRSDCDDLIERFGSEVAGWVATLSKDKRVPEETRERAYCAGLADAPWQVKVSKLADIFDNLLDSRALSQDQRRRAVERSQQYLTALNSPHLPEAARRAFDLVQRLLGEIEAGLA